MGQLAARERPQVSVCAVGRAGGRGLLHVPVPPAAAASCAPFTPTRMAALSSQTLVRVLPASPALLHRAQPLPTPHSFFLRLCSEVPILEDTLMRILVIGLSRELPLGPADAMELADHLVKRAAAVQADGKGPSGLVLARWALPAAMGSLVSSPCPLCCHHQLSYLLSRPAQGPPSERLPQFPQGGSPCAHQSSLHPTWGAGRPLAPCAAA